MTYRWAIMGISLLLATPASANEVALNFDSSAAVVTRQTFVEKTSKTPSTNTAVRLSFVPKPPGKPAEASPAPVTHVVLHTLEALFQGGSHSLVARAVGSAEGTRTADGGYTSAYYGHVDPGNHKWNLGSFSYQHGANSPAEADAKQLKRLYQQVLTLRKQANQRQIKLSLAEELNGIDLANQAPLAALDRGYIDWLTLARQQPMSEPERITWARTRAFLDPDSGRWNAPGLGNTLNSIRWDQARRQQAVQQAIDIWATSKGP